MRLLALNGGGQRAGHEECIGVACFLKCEERIDSANKDDFVPDRSPSKWNIRKSEALPTELNLRYFSDESVLPLVLLQARGAQCAT
jgi:hypothetical protein